MKRGATFSGLLAWTAAAFLVSSGCVSSQATWEAVGHDWFKKGASRDDFLRDKARCEADTAAAVNRAADDWGSANTQSVGNCLHDLGYRPWGERDIYDRARETIPMR